MASANSSTLSEANRENPLYPDHVVPLNYSSVETLPDSHSWNESEIERSTFSDGSEIPIIDLMDANVVEQIGHACEKFGVFLLKNHGIPLSLLNEVEEETKRLFSLPTEQKMKTLRGPGRFGGFGVVPIAQLYSKQMWYEGFTIVGSPSENVKKLWPESSDEYKRFCANMEDFQKHLKALAEKIVLMMFNLIGVPEQANRWIGSPDLSGSIQLNYYPLCPEPDRALGLAPHTDPSFFTILHRRHNGLQIFKEGVGWIPVPGDPNMLIVNTGDISHIVTNTRFHSVTHRVMMDDTGEKYSMAYFFVPPLEDVISPLVPSSEAKFRPVTVKDWISRRNNYKNFEEVLSFIKI